MTEHATRAITFVEMRGSLADLSRENVTNVIAGARVREPSPSLSVFDTVSPSCARNHECHVSALRLAREVAGLTNPKATRAITAWLSARPDMRGRWAEARALLWRRMKAIRRQRRAAR